MKKAIMLVLTVALLGSIAAGAAEWWEKKQYTQWSEKDVRKMLNDSPWTQDYKETTAEVEPENIPSLGPERESTLKVMRIACRFQIHSALPIRQALVRRAQLQQAYEKMPEDRQKIFDQEAEEFLAEDFSDRVVIFASCEPNVPADQEEMARRRREQTTETLKNSFFLKGSNGRTAELQEFEYVGESGQSFQLTFPRKVEGEALVGPGDKNLQLEFLVPGIRGRGHRRARVEFKTKKMVVDGQLEY